MNHLRKIAVICIAFLSISHLKDGTDTCCTSPNNSQNENMLYFSNWEHVILLKLRFSTVGQLGSALFRLAAMHSNIIIDRNQNTITWTISINYTLLSAAIAVKHHKLRINFLEIASHCTLRTWKFKNFSTFVHRTKLLQAGILPRAFYPSCYCS